MLISRTDTFFRAVCARGVRPINDFHECGGCLSVPAKAVDSSCIRRPHPPLIPTGLLTQDPPAPGRNSKDTRAIYQNMVTSVGLTSACWCVERVFTWLSTLYKRSWFPSRCWAPPSDTHPAPSLTYWTESTLHCDPGIKGSFCIRALQEVI